MMLYEVPRNTRIRLVNALGPDGKNIELHFHHIDGMYSFCTNEDGGVIHINACAEVEIVSSEDNNTNDTSLLV